jgi:peptidoglycan hydrolase-like protein with peptidoglycan-binding domain
MNELNIWLGISSASAIRASWLEVWIAYAPRMNALRSLGQQKCAPTSQARESSCVLLQRGSTGPEVKALQQKLVLLGFLKSKDMATGPGVYGPRTAAAVLEFQNTCVKKKVPGVRPSGVVDVATKAALERAVRELRIGQDRSAFEAQRATPMAALDTQSAQGPAPSATLTDEEDTVPEGPSVA